MKPDCHTYVSRTGSYNRVFPLHSHFCWELLYYTKGSGVLKLEGDESIPFCEGMLICVPPYVVHGSAGNTIFENICVQDFHFPQEMSRTLQARIACQGCVVFPQTNLDLLNLFQMVYRTYLRNPVPESTAVSHLMVCIYDILMEEHLTSMSLDFQVENMKNTICKNFTDPTYHVSESMQELPFSPAYVRSAFRKQYGMTPVQYLRNTRLKHAVSLFYICDTSLSITEIAYLSGFSDPLYFSKCFRQFYGISPQEYRQTIYRFTTETESEESP